MPMTSLDEFFTETLPPPDPLRDSIVEMVRRWHESTPRHQQVELGPSQIGTACMRKIAYGLMQVPRCNPEWDPLPSIIGTATHAWLQDAAEYANEQLGRKRWLTETKVEIATGLSGSCDLFDTDTGTVIDHKVLGVTSFMTKVKDPGPTYRHQGKMYGWVFQRLGYEVNTVAIALFPRCGTLSKMHVWQEPYNDATVDTVLTRRNAVIEMLDVFRVEVDPDRYRWIPAEKDQCQFCPQWSPNPKTGIQCPGDGT
jgi:hypothetical protein